MIKNVLKEYLVKITSDFDKKSFEGLKKSVLQNEEQVKKLKNAFLLSGKAASIFASSVAAASGVILNFIDSVADADVENTRFARTMFTSERAAYSMTNALSAMGKTFDDIKTMTPEEYKRFTELKEFYDSMEMPEDYSHTLSNYRDTMFSVAKVTSSIKHTLNLIAYNIVKYMGSSLDSLEEKLNNISEWISQNAEPIAEKIAIVGSGVLHIVNGAIYLLDLLFELGTYLNNTLTPEVKVLGVAMLAVWGASMLTPIGWIMTGLATILLLLSDISNWSSGKDSWFGEFYDAIDPEVFELGKGAIDGLVGSLNTLMDIVLLVLEPFTDLNTNLDETTALAKVASLWLESFLYALYTPLAVINNILVDIMALFMLLTGKGFEATFDYLGENRLDYKLPPMLEDSLNFERTLKTSNVTELTNVINIENYGEGVDMSSIVNGTKTKDGRVDVSSVYNNSAIVYP